MYNPIPPVTHRPPPRSTKVGRRLVDPASDPGETIFEHNKILQASILECLDRETDRFAEELEERNEEINEIRATKEEMALFLSHQILENKRLNTQLSLARQSLESIQNQSKTIAAGKIAAEQACKKVSGNATTLTLKVETLNIELEESKEMVRGMQLATAAFHSDIKVRTLTQQRLEQDNVILEDKFLEETAKYTHLKKLLQTKNIEEVEMSEERHSTMQLNSHLEVMLKSAESELLTCREDFQIIEKERNKYRDSSIGYQHQLLEIETIQTVTKQALEDQKKIHAQVLFEFSETKHTIVHLTAASKVKQEAIFKIEAALNIEKVKRIHAEDVLHKRGMNEDGSSLETRNLESEVVQLTTNNHALETTIQELRAALIQTQHDHTSHLENEKMNETAYDNSIINLKKEYTETIEQNKTKEIVLSNSISKIQAEKRSVDLMLMEISTQHHLLATKHVQLQALYVQSNDAGLKAEYTTERHKRKENQLIEKLRGSIQQQTNEHRLSSNLEKDSLKEQLMEMTSKLQTMKKSWIDLQTENVKLKRKFEYTFNKKKHLESSEAIQTQGKRRVQVENSKLNQTLTNERMQSNFQNVKLKQTREHLSSTTMQKENLKHQLEDARTILSGREADFSKAVNILRGTINVLQKQLREKKRTNRDILIQEQHSEGRQQLLKERLEVSQVELSTTKSELFELKAKYARITKGGTTNGAASKAKQAVEATKSLEAMLLKRRMQRMKSNATTSNQSRHQMKNNQDKNKTKTNMFGGMNKKTLQLQKAMRMAAERLHEIVVLKNALEKAEHQRRHYESKYKQVHHERARQEQQKVEQLAMANRALRAESMAAWMEQQLLATGNIQIDYTYHPEIDISSSLEKVLLEDNWLTSGDDIANAMSEKELAKLARGRETPML